MATRKGQTESSHHTDILKITSYRLRSSCGLKPEGKVVWRVRVFHGIGDLPQTTWLLPPPHSGSLSFNLSLIRPQLIQTDCGCRTERGGQGGVIGHRTESVKG